MVVDALAPGIVRLSAVIIQHHKTPLPWDNPETQRGAFSIMMVADGMAQNGHQAISSHYAVSSVTADYDKSHNSYAKCIYRATNVKQNILEAGLEVGNPLVPV